MAWCYTYELTTVMSCTDPVRRDLKEEEMDKKEMVGVLIKKCVCVYLYKNIYTKLRKNKLFKDVIHLTEVHDTVLISIIFSAVYSIFLTKFQCLVQRKVRGFP